MLAGRSWGRLARDVAPIALVLSLCPVVAALAPGPATPLAHIRALIGAERSVGLFFEPALHRWFAAHQPLLRSADLAYGLHLPITIGALLWVWRARPRAFPVIRDAFVGAQLLTVLGYVMLPTAPPRMVPGVGYGAVAGAGEQGLARLAQSPYAAMPSGHIAFAIVIGATVAALARRPIVRALALAYPVVIALEIFATGNHLWLDAVGGATAAALGFAFACSPSRVRARSARAPQPAAAESAL